MEMEIVDAAETYGVGGGVTTTPPPSSLDSVLVAVTLRSQNGSSRGSKCSTSMFCRSFIPRGCSSRGDEEADAEEKEEEEEVKRAGERGVAMERVVVEVDEDAYDGTEIKGSDTAR